MKLADIVAGGTVFVDANILVFALANHATYGALCDEFLDRVENQEIIAFTSAHVVGEVIHRMMTIEASNRFGWPVQGIANRLRRHPAEVQQLVRPRQALDEIAAARVNVLAVTVPHVSDATDISRKIGLLYNDALVVAMMRDQAITQLASLDSDFDLVPGVVRFAPS
jgi:predicted nucleic acid-binding protein